MIKKLFILQSIFFSVVASSQVLTYVGNSALVTIQSQTLFYNGGGLQTFGSAVVNNSGNVMISGTATGVPATEPRIDLATTANFNLRLASTTDYGQLYVTGIAQGNIAGKVNKEYTADYNNGTTGRQQTGLPFFNFTYADLKAAFGDGNLNLTNGGQTLSGRFNPSSIFKWNNERARFDQIVGGTDATVIGTPLTYYIIPRRRADNTYFWVPNTDKKTFTGIPVSDMTTSNVQMSLSGGYAGSFGYNGNAANYYTEQYRTYLDDPFRSKTPNWAADYALNLYQLANPFLTNLDLKFIGLAETGNASDGNNISNLVGIAYYGSGNITNTYAGSQYNNGNTIVALASSGVFQAGDISASRLVIKPMGEFMVKLSSNAAQTINLNRTRRFAYTSRADGVDYSVAFAKDGDDTGIPEDKIVKQVAVVMYDADGLEIARTYYAVSPSAVTGYSPATTMLQAYATDDKVIFTKEEKLEGGEDINHTDKVYINEANEVNFKSKLIPLFINYDQPYQLKFEVYEKGERAADGLSNGNSFYIKNPSGQYVKIVDGESLSLSGAQNLALSYELPESGTLGNENSIFSKTVIAKKDNKWVVRFAKDWKNATVEVYSVAGQLLNSKSQISTGSDYEIPLNYQAKSVFLVKTVSEKGEVVIKKISN
ncbi:hypothetical protein LUD75_16055 [Epilithonimonas sp. JDS]|uniref:hypothetical protein n=1 Tax=Epilithonimonas sp. JDS TaxID=2902797 RepID=UPI001E4CBB46|nr:hypothetical protein [Epilithonimonas sp. JDS]MCD9856241.1 hypothetical protein [Epilithonimonas sp. JDS]